MAKKLMNKLMKNKIPNVKCSILIEEMLEGYQRKIDLFIFFGIVFLAFLKWG